MNIRDLPPGTKFLFSWDESSYYSHLGTIDKNGVASCSCGSSLENNTENEVYPIIEWEDEIL